MRRRAALAAIVGGALALAGGAPATTYAATNDDDAIVVWDGDTDQIVQVEDEVFGHLVVVPGSHQERTLRVQNTGPTAGTLTVAIVNASAHTGGDGWVDDTFYEDLTINGIRAIDLVDVETDVATVPLGQGGDTTITFTVDFPFEATSGNNIQVGDRLFEFDVRLTISGDTPENTSTDTTTPTGADTGTTTTTTTTTSGTKPESNSGLTSQTGGTALRPDTLLLLAAAAAVATAATLTLRTLAMARRRRARVKIDGS